MVAAITRPVLAGVIALGIAGLVAGCGGTSPSPPMPVATSSGTMVGGTSPVAIETNPAGDIPDSQAFVDFSPPGEKSHA